MRRSLANLIKVSGSVDYCLRSAVTASCSLFLALIKFLGLTSEFCSSELFGVGIGMLATLGRKLEFIFNCF